MRRTKIICTLGPATDGEGVLEQLVENGMDVARFNFSMVRTRNRRCGWTSLRKSDSA